MNESWKVPAGWLLLLCAGCAAAGYVIAYQDCTKQERQKYELLKSLAREFPEQENE